MVLFEIVPAYQAVEGVHEFFGRLQLYAVDGLQEDGQGFGVFGDEVVHKPFVIQYSFPVPGVAGRLIDVNGRHGSNGKRSTDRVGELGQGLALRHVRQAPGLDGKVVKLLQEILLENALLAADGDHQEVVVRFEFVDKLPEELQVFIPFREKLFEIERKFQLPDAEGADDGQNGEDGDGNDTEVDIHSLVKK